MVERANVEKIGSILGLTRPTACILQRCKERPVDCNDLLDVNKGVDEMGEDFSPASDDGAAEMLADKVDEELSNGGQSGHIRDEDQMEGATACKQDFDSLWRG